MSPTAKQRWRVPMDWRVSVVLQVVHTVQSVGDVAMQPTAVNCHVSTYLSTTEYITQQSLNDYLRAAGKIHCVPPVGV